MKLRSFLSDDRGIILLTLIASACVWMMVIPLYSPDNNQLIPDSSSYLTYANHFIHHLHHDVVRTPGYPFLLFLLKQFSIIFNIPLLTLIYLSQSILFSLGIFLLSEIVRSSLGKKAAIFFTIFLALNPSYFVYNFLVLTEPLFFFLVCTSVYFFFRFFKHKEGIKNRTANQFFENSHGLYDNKKSHTLIHLPWFNFGRPFNIYLSLVSACLATLTRPGFYYFNLLYFIIILFILWRRRKLLLVLVSISIYSAIILSIQWNFYSNHQLFKISTIDILTRHRYLRNAISCERSSGDRLMLLTEQDSVDNLFTQSLSVKERQKALNDYYREQWNKTTEGHEALVLKVYSQNILENIHTGNSLIPQGIPENRKSLLFNTTRIWNMFFVTFFLLQLLVLTIYGTHELRLKKEKSQDGWLSQQKMLWFLCFLVGYQILSSGVSFWQGDRLFITSQPFILLLGILMTSMIQKKRKATIS